MALITFFIVLHRREQNVGHSLHNWRFPAKPVNSYPPVPPSGNSFHLCLVHTTLSIHFQVHFKQDSSLKAFFELKLIYSNSTSELNLQFTLSCALKDTLKLIWISNHLLRSSFFHLGLLIVHIWGILANVLYESLIHLELYYILTCSCVIFFCQTSAQFSITQQNKSFGYLSTHNNNKAQNIRNMSQHSKETPNILKNLKIMIGIWENPKNLWMIIDNGKEITGCHSKQVANHRNFMNTVYPNDKCSILNHDCLF